MNNLERGAVYRQYLIDAITELEVIDPTLMPKVSDDGSVTFKLTSGEVCFAKPDSDDDYFYLLLCPFLCTPQSDDERVKATFAALAVCDNVKVAKVGFAGGDETISASVEMFCDPSHVIPKIVFLRGILALRQAAALFSEQMQE